MTKLRAYVSEEEHKYARFVRLVNATAASTIGLRLCMTHPISFIHALREREVCGRPSAALTAAAGNKLLLAGTLHGHRGCVNRLAWSDDGELLASCAEDRTVCLWSVSGAAAVLPRLVASFATSHTNNVVGVRFLPHTDCRVLVTGGSDGMVEVHHLTALAPAPSSSSAAASAPSSSSSSAYGWRESSQQLHCHRDRVKYIDNEPASPHVFFSAGDDGYIGRRSFTSPARLSLPSSLIPRPSSLIPHPARVSPPSPIPFIPHPRQVRASVRPTPAPGRLPPPPPGGRSRVHPGKHVPLAQLHRRLPRAGPSPKVQTTSVL